MHVTINELITTIYRTPSLSVYLTHPVGYIQGLTLAYFVGLELVYRPR